jgi:hypothetical protein
MDFGVGTFIFASAITSKYARNISQLSSSNQSNIQSTGNKSTKLSFFLTTYFLLQRITILVLGSGRLIMLKITNYQEHVSEYGIHWNFFVTLFCIWTLADLIHLFFPRKLMPWLASVILCIHQVMLSHGMSEYIISAPRTDFISSNREGILSIGGLLPLYLYAEHISYQIFFKQKRPVSRSGTPLSTDKVSNITKYTTSSNPNHKNGLNITDNPNVCLIDTKEEYDGETRSRSGLPSKTILSTTSHGQEKPTLFDEKNDHNNHNSNMDSEDDDKDSIRNVTPVITEYPAGLALTPDSQSPSNPTSIRILGIQWRVLLQTRDRLIARQLITLSGSLWSMWVLSSLLVQPTSRRLSNLPFVLFCLALSCSLLLLCLVADSITGSSRVLSLEYMNQYSLPVFLFANVLTGLTNMALPTMYMPPTSSFLVLSFYTAAVVAVAWFLGSRRAYNLSDA